MFIITARILIPAQLNPINEQVASARQEENVISISKPAV
jgi:hypothetical protein